MRHESEYEYHKSRRERHYDQSSDDEEIPRIQYERSERDNYYNHKKRKHKRHRERDHRVYEDVVMIHGSSSEDEKVDLEEIEARNHRRRHKKHCGGHRRKHKEVVVEEDDEEEEKEVSERETFPQSPVHIKKEETSDSEIERPSQYQKKRKRRSKSRENLTEVDDKTGIKRDVVDANERVKSEPKAGDSSTGRVRKSRFDPKPNEQWGQKGSTGTNSTQPGQKEKPNFELSGKLAEDTNMYNGVLIKYSEPPEARKPKRRWRLYPFKGDQALPPLYIHRQSAYLMGRDRKVADIPIDHPSCSKQHAALQYRLVPFQRSNGTMGKQIKLYIIDLESANGTFINNKKIEAKKYVELLERDVVKFGFSSREYVLLHEHSKDDDEDDDVQQPLDDQEP